MNITNGCFTDELKVFCRKYDTVERELEHTVQRDERNADCFYRMLWILSGSATVILDSCKETIHSDSMVFIRPHGRLYFEFKQNKPYEYVLISIHPSVFEKRDVDEKFLRAFVNITERNAILSFKDGRNEYIHKQLISIKKCVYLDLGKYHLEPRIFSIISELCILNDALFAEKNEDTDIQHVKILDYIRRHYTDDELNAALIKEKFFVSFPTLNTFVVNYTGMTFWNYVTDLRLKNAQKLMADGYPAVKAAELSGFCNYSSFYRAYVKKHGVSPKADKNARYKRWPLS